MTQIIDYTLCELAEMLKKKEVSATEATKACLERIEQTEPKIDALLSVQAEEALPPSVVEESQANIAQLRRAMSEGSSILLQKCVRYLLAHPPIGHP